MCIRIFIHEMDYSILILNHGRAARQYLILNLLVDRDSLLLARRGRVTLASATGTL